jgi:hypothetical protein
MPKHASSDVWLEEQSFHRSRARTLDHVRASVVTPFEADGALDLERVEHNARILGGFSVLA